MIHSTKQILITGCYRTGSEYLTLLMNNHPKLSASMYVVGFMRFCYDRYNPIENEDNYSRLIFDCGQRIQTRWQKKLDVYKILEECKKSERVTYPLLYDLMMSDLYLTEDVTEWAEKTQLVWTKIPAFLEMFPNGKAIHIVRDPRNVLSSFKRVTYVPEPAYLSAIFNCRGSMQLGLEYKKKFDANRYYLVKYEDLITSPGSTLLELFNFLELTPDHDLLSEEGWCDPWGNPWHHNSAYLSAEAQGADFDKQASISTWKNNLSSREIALCESIIADLMEDYGYVRSDEIESWPTMLAPILSDDTLTGYLRRWSADGAGVEAFPTDPLVPANWGENVQS